MEERIEKLEKLVAELVTENKGLKQDISSLKTKLNSIELKNQDYLTRIMNLEKKEKYAQIQQKLTNAPKLNVKHNHTDWITTLCLMNGRYVLTGSKDCSIKCLTIGDDDDDEPVLFTIEKAHQSEVQYILKISDSEVISCGDEGIIKRWFVDCKYSFEKDKSRYKLLEIFSINGNNKVHDSAYKIIKLKNGDLCSCGKGSRIKFWKQNKETDKHEKYKELECKAEYVQSVLELDDNKLVAGGWHSTQFYDIKEFKSETIIKDTFTEHANAMIRMGDKIICSGWGIFFIDIKTQQLLGKIQIEYECEEGIYALAPLTNNLIICGGNLRTIDIYDIDNYEKIASRPIDDEFIFDVKNDHGGFLFCGSKNIFGYILSEFNDGKRNNEEAEEDED